MSWIDRNLREEITWWKNTGADPDRSGGFSFASPVVVRGRYEDYEENETDGDIRTIESQSTVYLDRDVDEEDYLARGDYTSEADPTELRDAFQVRRVSRLTDLRNLDVHYRAWL